MQTRAWDGPGPGGDVVPDDADHADAWQGGLLQKGADTDSETEADSRSSRTRQLADWTRQGKWLVHLPRGAWPGIRVPAAFAATGKTGVGHGHTRE